MFLCVVQTCCKCWKLTSHCQCALMLIPYRNKIFHKCSITKHEHICFYLENGNLLRCEMNVYAKQKQRWNKIGWENGAKVSISYISKHFERQSKVWTSFSWFHSAVHWFAAFMLIWSGRTLHHFLQVTVNAWKTQPQNLKCGDVLVSCGRFVFEDWCQAIGVSERPSEVCKVFAWQFTRCDWYTRVNDIYENNVCTRAPMMCVLPYSRMCHSNL